VYEYRSEIIETGVKWFKDSANYGDVDRMDDLINNRAEEGWELVCHSYMVNVFSARSSILLTFKRMIQ
jgi:hypothetical protein